MTIDLRARGIQTVLLDIEGTTTPIAFVHEVLFPYARRHLREYLRQGPAEAADAIARLRAEAGDLALDGDRLAAFVESLMDRDVKSTGLKELQGAIWRSGYDRGELRGQVFDDVPPALRRWKRAGLGAAIYSSGSVLAQQMLFSTIPSGSLLPMLDAFFDTAVGPKTASESYGRIAAELVIAPERLLFVSDGEVEIDAARAAGCHVVLSIRPGNRLAEPRADVPHITTFADLIA